MPRGKRFEDWTERLEYFLWLAQGRAFAWGAWDCSLFGAEGVKALTGDDFGAAFRGQYSDAAGAAQALIEIGEGDLESTVTSFMGPPLSLPAKAQRGDLVLFESGDGPALGIIELTGTHFAAVTTRGTVRLPRARALQAWRV
jgi:hypothetical protein